MNALSLFSGIGGLDIAAEWAGFKIVAFCERDEFCRRVLRKHWPEVRIFDDVRTLDASELPTIDIVFGGYPCQPFSQAGKRAGHADERHLWPEMFRLVRELAPTWVVGENVKGHVTLGLDEVLDDLEGAGYAARAFVFPACAVGAPHTRERLFVVAHSASARQLREEQQKNCNTRTQRGSPNDSSEIRSRARWDVWASESRPESMAYGVRGRVDRLRVYGNAVVPQQAYPIFAAIAKTYNATGEARPE